MIHRSPYPDLQIPEVHVTDFVLRNAARLGDKPALIDAPTGRTITYAQLTQMIRRTAAGLYARGFRKGDVLAVLSPNAPEYAVAFHGAALAGGVVTTVNPLNTAGEVAGQLRDARAKFLVTVPPLLDAAREAAAADGSLVEEIFVFGEAEGATPFAALLESGAPEFPRPEVDPREDTVALPYSSGTTGASKGVMLTHHSLVANLCQLDSLNIVSEHDTLLCVLPMFHIFGLHVVLNHGLLAGATVVTVPRFDLDTFMRLLQDYRVRIAHIVPPILLGMINHPAREKYDLSNLKLIFSGAAPLGEALIRECRERLGCVVRQGYGMTETSPAIHISPAEDDQNKFGSVGVCVPNTECKIVDTETGALLGRDAEGEICMRGPQLMKGYLNRPDATAETIDAEGWLHTGDIGRVDDDGHLFVVDRAKELIKYKGFQVAPAELESLLLSHPAVADAAVIPSPDDEAGEIPKAFVVLARGNGTTAEELISFVAARVAPHKKIRRVEFIEQIPKSPSGKILRRLLVQREREQS